MKKNRLLTVLVKSLIVMMAILGFVSCEPRVRESDVAFAEPILDNILEAMVEEDYAKFSSDLSDAMKEAIEKQGFQSVLSELQESLGAYQGREFARAVKTSVKGMDLVIITYRAQFEKDDAATITMYISGGSGRKIVEGFMAAPSGGAK